MEKAPLSSVRDSKRFVRSVRVLTSGFALQTISLDFHPFQLWCRWKTRDGMGTRRRPLRAGLGCARHFPSFQGDVIKFDAGIVPAEWK